VSPVLTVQPLETMAIAEVANLVAREHAVARGHRPGLPAAYTEPEHCQEALTGLVSGSHAFVAREMGVCVGVMCGRAVDVVGFIPADGLAVDPAAPDPTATVVGLCAELVPALLAEGARRITIDHVDLAPLGIALSNLGFGRGGVFATQTVRPAPLADTATGIEIRIGTPDDLDAIAALSHIEFSQRSAPPIYGAPRPRSLDDTRDRHRRLLDDGAVHLLARRHGDDVGLLTIELTSPAPRLCRDGQPYIGPTATDPSARGQGVGHALAHAAHDWAHRTGYHTISVDFEPSNPLSRPFWLGLGFEPTGYRLRRTIDTAHTVPTARPPACG
jgi:GNAT superfamily N-acetyltransferase